MAPYKMLTINNNDLASCICCWISDFV